MSVERAVVKSANQTFNKVRLVDLAQAAGCSIATVSRSLNDSPLINRVTKTRIWQIARNQGYTALPGLPQSLPSAQATLAVMIPTAGAGEAADPFLGNLINGLIQASHDSLCNLTFSHLGPAACRNLGAVLQQSQADAHLFLGHKNLHDGLNELDSDACRFLVWGAPVQGQTYPTIGPDNFACGAEAVAWLAASGCRRIAYLGDTDGADMTQRFMGYLTALNEAGLAFDPGLVLRPPFVANLAVMAVDGLFIASENAYIPALSELAGAGLSVPGDVRIIGYSTGMTPFSYPTLSIDMRAAGKRIIARLLGAESEVVLKTEKLPLQLNTGLALVP